MNFFSIYSEHKTPNQLIMKKNSPTVDFGSEPNYLVLT